MKFTVNGIQILNSQVGEGIRIGDKTIGTAYITSATFEEGKTLEDFAKEGMVVGYEMAQPAQGEEGGVTSPADLMKLNFDDISGATNYVLFIREPQNEDGTPGNCSIVLNTKDITRAFGLPDEDAETMRRYLGMTAKQRQLEVVDYTDLDTGEPAIFFVNKFDREIVDAMLDNDHQAAVTSYQNMLVSSEFRSQLITHSFIKTFLMVIVQAGQDRYNKIYRDDNIEKAAKILSGITYWKDGVLHSPSVKDINDYAQEVTEHIIIER